MAAKGAVRLPVAARTASASAIRAETAVRSPVHAVAGAQGGQVDRELVERADVTSELDLPQQHRAPRYVVPQGAGGRLRQPAPPEFLFGGDAVAGKEVSDLAQGRCRGGGSVRDQHGEGMKDQGGLCGEWTAHRPLAARETSVRSPAPAKRPANSAAIHALR